MKRWSAVLFCVALAVVSVTLHLIYGWHAYVDDAATHGEQAEMRAYLIQWMRDTTENLQSEFWQLAVQFAILAGAMKWLGVQAHEEDQEEVKAKLDAIDERLTNVNAVVTSLSYQQLAARKETP